MKRSLRFSCFSFDSESNQSSSQSRHPTIVTLAKTYRIQYVKMIKEINGITNNQSEKRPSETPVTAAVKRQRSSPSSTTTAAPALNSNNILQTLRNRIRKEENEQFYFDDERKR